MTTYPRSVVVLPLLWSLLAASLSAQESLPTIPPIKRLLPPPGIEIPADVRKELTDKLAALTPRVNKLTDNQQRPDIAIFTDAVALALKFGEFYDRRDFDKARWALAQAEERLTFAEAGNYYPWLKQTGLVVRGYRSFVDDSVQPYGLVIPEKHDFDKRVQLFVWLHGRGDKATNLHFLRERATRVGEIVPPGAIVVHPFGRHCLGFKSAGEIDVIDIAQRQQVALALSYPVLIGFSMGGAGAWHIGAHYPERWVAVSPGAGFVDVARYQKLRPSNYPPAYEQLLWGDYDIPAYTRNLFNLPVIAYSGENDPQKQAADIMAEAFKNEGRELTHLIGPGMGHQYHPEVKQELVKRLAEMAQLAIAADVRPVPVPRVGPRLGGIADPKDPLPREVKLLPNLPEAHLQTRTLRYPQGGWLRAYGLEQHWHDARLDGKRTDGHFEIATKNVTRFQASVAGAPDKRTFAIDGQVVEGATVERELVHFVRREGKWQAAPPFDSDRRSYGLCKWPRLQGPIDDAFLARFLVVTPTAQSPHPRVQQWVEFELDHFVERWQALFRGNVRTKRDVDVTAEDLRANHIVCFGDATSNKVIAAALAADSIAKLPLAWDQEKLALAGKEYDATTHVPLLIYPNPLAPSKYLVLNSGPTFREAHDRTNSLQNPKLPDWAVIDITTHPSATAPGKVVAADFFDEQWQVKK